MDEEEYIKYLMQRDDEIRPERVRRRFELTPAAYDVHLPESVWEYQIEMDDMYINGHFKGAILFSASILEASLRDQLRSKSSTTQKELSALDFQAMSILSRELGIITEEEKYTIDKVRIERNMLIHMDSKKMAKEAKRLYKGFDEFVSVALYSIMGIPEKALEFLNFTTNLTLKFYGVDNNESIV